MTEKEKSRQKVKERCETVANFNRNILLELATGVGKTFNAINLQNRMNPSLTYICVSERSHIQNWKDEYIKHGFQYLLKSTKIFCYASLKKYTEKVDLLILDEMHKFSSESRVDLLYKLKPKRVIGLSATITEEHKFLFKSIFGNYGHVKITMAQAIDMHLLPRPKFYLMPLDLEESERTESFVYSRGRHSDIQKLDYEKFIVMYNRWKTHPNLNIEVLCSQREKYNWIETLYGNAKRAYMSRRTDYNKNTWLRLGLTRKAYLSECKTKHLLKLLSKINDKRFICFCGNIEQANEAGSTNAVHSKNKDSVKIYESFNKKEIDNIFAVGMLVEGVNLVDIDAAVIVQLDGTSRTLVQKSGRSFRSDNPEMYIMFFRQTKDTDYLKNVIENIPKEYINVLKL